MRQQHVIGTSTQADGSVTTYLSKPNAMRQFTGSYRGSLARFHMPQVLVADNYSEVFEYEWDATEDEVSGVFAVEDVREW